MNMAALSADETITRAILPIRVEFFAQSDIEMGLTPMKREVPTHQAFHGLGVHGHGLGLGLDGHTFRGELKQYEAAHRPLESGFDDAVPPVVTGPQARSTLTRSCKLRFSCDAARACSRATRP